MAERTDLIDAFLDRAGWCGAARSPLAADASFRRYERVRLGARGAVLMDAPPDKEDVGPYLGIARHLRRLGYSAPEVLAEDEAAGLVLLEDLGDDTYTRLLADGADEAALYRLAIDVLINLHARPAAEVVPVGLPAYDDALLLGEADLLIDWYLPAVAGSEADAAARASWRACWSALLPVVRRAPETLVLRDYHVDNLMRIEGRDGVAACGLLDFQDAVAGPASYDLVSLLEDARRDIADALAARMLDRYFAALPALDRDGFETSYAALGAQRHCKVIGIFTRLCVRDGKAQYLRHVPRVWRLLERAIERPALAPLADWLAAHIPPSRRIVPSCPPTP